MNGSALVSVVWLVLAALCSEGCKQEEGGPINRNLPTTTLHLGSERFIVEIADDDEERATGLMNRRSLPADRGMIFVFPREQQLSFYMRNTLIPLDIVYLDAEGTVVSIHQMQPLDLTSVPSRAPAKYAIELNQGTAERLGLKPGDRVRIPPEAADTDR